LGKGKDSAAKPSDWLSVTNSMAAIVVISICFIGQKREWAD
jgi:hypothetical protein